MLSKQFLVRVLHAKPQTGQAVATSIACAEAAAASKRCAVVVMVIRKYVTTIVVWLLAHT